MSDPERRYRHAGAIIASALMVFVLGGLALERQPDLAGARRALRGNAGLAGLLDDGIAGRALAEAATRFGARGLLRVRPESLPSTLVLSEEQLQGKLPVVSIVADEDALHDPDTGIIANMQETGPEWERLSWISFWEEGVLELGSRAGLRLHGDTSRGAGMPSFRLHFRPIYGATSATGGRFFGAEARPAAVVVLHVVLRAGFYPNVFVFEVARRLGLPVSEFRPARVFINGEERGVYVLTERVMPDGWGRSYFGHSDFYMSIYKGETKRRSGEAHAEIERWATDNAPMTMEQIAERIDVDNLTKHLLALMFCFTTDWAQGAALLDRTDPEARWFWLHWDMDQSFYSRGRLAGKAWEQPVMELITLDAETSFLEGHGILTDERHTRRHTIDLRRILFNQLLEDPDYQAYFLRVVSDALNHQLTPSFFDSMLARYEFLARQPGVFGDMDMHAYLENRPAFLRAEVARHFGLGDPQTVQLLGPDDVEYTVDGFPERGPWQGTYFPGQEVRLSITSSHRDRLLHWEVNGETIDAEELVLAVDTPTQIRPILAES